MLDKHNADSPFSQDTNRKRPNSRGLRAYSPRQKAILARHMTDPTLLQEHRETLTGGAPFVRRGHADRFPGRSNADLFRSVGGSSLRSAEEMSTTDAELFAGVALRCWGRQELARYRYDYQPTWFSGWLRRVIRDASCDRRVSRGLVDFAWSFFNAERCEAMTLLTYNEFAAHFAVARSTIGEWLKLLRSAAVIESAHTWARDDGKTSARRDGNRRHARCYGANLYRLGSAVADEVRIAIREGCRNATFQSGRTMEHAARRCGQELRAQMRGDITERRNQEWYRRKEREEGLSNSFLSRPISGHHRALLPSVSNPPQAVEEEQIKVRPSAAAASASPARTQLDPASATKPARATADPSGPGKAIGVSAAFKDILAESSSDFARRFLNSLHALVIFVICTLVACTGEFGHGPQIPRIDRSTPQTPRNSHLARTDSANQPRRFAVRRAHRPRPARKFERDFTEPGRAIRLGGSAKLHYRSNEREPMTAPKKTITIPATITGSIRDAKEGKFKLAANIRRASRVVFTWTLPHELIVNSTNIAGCDVFDEPANAAIRKVVSGGKTLRRIPARIGPGDLSIECHLRTVQEDDNRKFKDVPKVWITLNCTRPEETTLETAKAPNPLTKDADGFPRGAVAVDTDGNAHRITDLPETGQA